MKIATFGLFCLTVFLGLFPNVKAEASYRPPAYHAPAYRPAPVYRPPVYHAPRVQRGPVYRQPQARGPVYRSPQGHGPVHRPPVVTHRFNPARHHGPHYGLHGHFLNGVWYADPNDPPYDGQAGDIDEGGGGLSTLAWSVTNNSGQNLRLEFRSENRDNVWPGNGQVYTLPSGGGINASLSCQAGEHICWGAWNSDSSRYWGTGRGGNRCTNCCHYCDGTATNSNLTP